MLIRPFLAAVRDLVLLLALPVMLPIAFVLSKRQKADRLVWGHTPIINNKYWSAAVRALGYQSLTLMSGYYGGINDRKDFDLYFEDIFPLVKPQLLRKAIMPWLVLCFLARNAAVLHISFDGGAFSRTRLWRLEAIFYRMLGIRTIIMPYGADFYVYSKVFDPCIRHGLLLSYPEAARREKAIDTRVGYWVRHADIILAGYTLEGLSRWDVPIGNMLCIDLQQWVCKASYSDSDGRNRAVRVLHNPNHVGVKGTEFINEAVAALQRDGLQVELVTLSGVQNSRIRTTMQEVDIHADQLILPGYGMAAIEAMASGLPVIANLSDHRYTSIFRRFSYLNECPVVSATPETIEQVLRALVSSPALRKELGLANRAYVQKYHSYEASQYLFGAVYDRILKGNKDVELMSLFHPIKSAYVKRSPKVEHPLVNNNIPSRSEAA
ncbi:hypothetical protein Herbaro_02110 [Herbaspirillum sp. WKF16]|uniref:glycosyltransferase family protein n=1 Tax=Herbaspirillum sp. WKF16 TaxID=3028312 RepID=UPI0023AA03DC|nr:glycosyltransferase [Herbaspirillum sp. WKF16]WDZ96599.1 hypothetical protein Herbaro_02110 [Herbaspirillum sp. WKF16]